MNLSSALALSLLLAGVAHSAPLVTPYARNERLGITSVSLSATHVPRYSRADVTVGISAHFDNPFDPEDVALDAQVTTPSGKTLAVPGYFGRSYQRDLVNGRERLTAAGAGQWHLRFAPMETGPYSVVLIARDRSGAVRSQPVAFIATPSTDAGFVRLSARDRRYFEFDNGASYFPVGANVCWAYGRGTFDYDNWFSGYATNGGNYARLWLSPNWTSFALERTGKREEGLGLGQYDLANAWRLDYVLDLAASHGMRLMLCVDSYNILRQKDGYPQWDNTPHNVVNGGPLAKPADFWTNEEMARLYRAKMRYLVARYGASTAVLSWEFWNEVDITTGYRTAPVKAWHERMAAALRAIDPYRHLITTSFAGTRGDKEIDTLPGLDYVQTHHYNSADLAVTVATAQAQKSVYGKPHLIGEIGADSGGPRTTDDPEGLQIHDPQWVSIVTGCAGSAQPWWWDNLIHPRSLYPLFGSVSRFVAAIDWPAEQFHAVTPQVDWSTRPMTPARKDITFTGPVGWEPSEFNRPRHVQVTRLGADGDLPLAGIQHGLKNHHGEHNPVTFEVNLPWATRFEVLVTDVSGYGGAALKIVRDGQAISTNVFSVPAGIKSGSLKQYAGSYGVDVPAGKHTLVVENTGADWFMASYRFRDAVERMQPPLLAWGSVGANTALAWVRTEDRTWQRLCARKETVPPSPPSVITLHGLTPGKWKMELWDTWRGTATASREIQVDQSGDARLPLPEIPSDLAIKMLRQK